METSAKEKALLDRVEALQDEMFDLTARLVAEPSVLGNEAGALAVMEEAMSDMGLDLVRVAMDDPRLLAHPEYASVPGVSADGRHNLVGIRRAEETGGNSCLYNGHLDVVPPGPADMWSTPPFDPVIRDGWMHGRGAGDMKAGVAAMATALRAVSEAGFGLRAEVILEAVIEEENSGNGALACRAAGFDARAVLIPEPFGPTMLTAQPGVLWFRVSVRGRATHVLQAGAGANAIEKCWPLIQALRNLEAEMNHESRPGPWEAMEHPIHLNVGRIQGGDWPSTVAAEAFFEARLAFLPPADFKDTAERIRLCVGRAAVADPWLESHPPQVDFFGFRSEGHVVSGVPEPCRVLADCHRSLAGSAPETYTATCTTDLRAFYLSGPDRATCFGPVAENIHGPDERVRLDSVLHTAGVYALFLARWCGLAE